LGAIFADATIGTLAVKLHTPSPSTPRELSFT